VSQLGLRFYSSELGRWTRRDPLGESGGLNLYEIVGNSIWDAVDVLGLCMNGCKPTSRPELIDTYSDPYHFTTPFKRWIVKSALVAGGASCKCTADLVTFRSGFVLSCSQFQYKRRCEYEIKGCQQNCLSYEETVDYWVGTMETTEPQEASRGQRRIHAFPILGIGTVTECFDKCLNWAAGLPGETLTPRPPSHPPEVLSTLCEIGPS
jgi:hypothetical protein